MGFSKYIIGFIVSNFNQYILHKYYILKSYFIRSLCFQMKNDFKGMTMDLVSCLKLDSNLEYVKQKLYKVLKLSVIVIL